MNPRTRAASIATVGLIAVGSVSACSSSEQTGATAPPPSSASSSAAPSASASESRSPAASPTADASSAQTAGATITIEDYAYRGATSVPAGAKVTVTNDDDVAHTVTADEGGAFDVVVAPGESATFIAPAAPGAYPYHCTYHGNMHGTLKVG